ncbi:hypothetical protein V8E36_003094 [Tilletia maclaganii]
MARTSSKKPAAPSTSTSSAPALSAAPPSSSSTTTTTTTADSRSSSARPSPLHVSTLLPSSTSGNSTLSTSSTQYSHIFSSPTLLSREFSTASSSASSHTSLDQESLSVLLLHHSDKQQQQQHHHHFRHRQGSDAMSSSIKQEHEQHHPHRHAELEESAPQEQQQYHQQQLPYSLAEPPRTPPPIHMRRSLYPPVTPTPGSAYTQNPYQQPTQHNKLPLVGSLSEQKRKIICRPVLGGRFFTPPFDPALRSRLPQLDWPDSLHGPWSAASERMLLERRKRAQHFHRWLNEDDYSDIEDEYAAAELLEPEVNAYLASSSSTDGSSSMLTGLGIDPAIHELELRRREETLADDLYHPMVAKALRDRMRKEAEAKAAVLADLQRHKHASQLQRGNGTANGRQGRGRPGRRQAKIDHDDDAASSVGTSAAFTTPSKRSTKAAAAAAAAPISPTKRRRKNAADQSASNDLDFPTTAPPGGRREKKATSARKRATSSHHPTETPVGPLSLSATGIATPSEADTSTNTTPLAFGSHHDLHPYPETQPLVPSQGKAQAQPNTQCPCGHAQPPSLSAFVHEPASPSHGRGKKNKKKPTSRSKKRHSGGSNSSNSFSKEDAAALTLAIEEGDEDAEGGEPDEDEAAMVLCDSCHVWHHLACVGIGSVDELGDEWFCDPCCRSAAAALERRNQSLGTTPPLGGAMASGSGASASSSTIAPSFTVATSSGGSTFMSTPSFLRTFSAQGQLTLLAQNPPSSSEPGHGGSATSVRSTATNNPFLRGSAAGSGSNAVGNAATAATAASSGAASGLHASGGSASTMMLSGGPTLGMGLYVPRTPLMGGSSYTDSSPSAARMLGSSSSMTLVPSSAVSGMRSMNKMLGSSPMGGLSSAEFGLGFGAGGPYSPTAMLSRTRKSSYGATLGSGRTPRQYQHQQRGAGRGGSGEWTGGEPASPLDLSSTPSVGGWSGWGMTMGQQPLSKMLGSSSPMMGLGGAAEFGLGNGFGGSAPYSPTAMLSRAARNKTTSSYGTTLGSGRAARQQQQAQQHRGAGGGAGGGEPGSPLGLGGTPGGFGGLGGWGGGHPLKTRQASTNGLSNLTFGGAAVGGGSGGTAAAAGGADGLHSTFGLGLGFDFDDVLDLV